jgi:hypothetical protein
MVRATGSKGGRICPPLSTTETPASTCVKIIAELGDLAALNKDGIHG